MFFLVHILPIKAHEESEPTRFHVSMIKTRLKVFHFHRFLVVCRVFLVIWLVRSMKTRTANILLRVMRWCAICLINTSVKIIFYIKQGDNTGSDF